MYEEGTVIKRVEVLGMDGVNKGGLWRSAIVKKKMVGG